MLHVGAPVTSGLHSCSNAALNPHPPAAPNLGCLLPPSLPWWLTSACAPPAPAHGPAAHQEERQWWRPVGWWQAHRLRLASSCAGLKGQRQSTAAAAAAAAVRGTDGPTRTSGDCSCAGPPADSSSRLGSPGFCAFSRSCSLESGCLEVCQRQEDARGSLK